MEPSPRVPPQQFAESMKREFEEFAKQVMDAVNDAPDGQWIAGSEEQVRDLCAEMRQKVFELAALQGGCLAPIAAWGCVEGERLTLIGRVISRDGAKLLEAADSLSSSTSGRGAGGEGDILANALQLGRQVAESLLAKGASCLIEASREA